MGRLRSRWAALRSAAGVGSSRGDLGVGALLLAATVVVVAVDGFWVEPQRLLLADRVELGLPTAPFRLIHLSDLHIAREGLRERRLLEEVAAARPSLIVISGDLVAGSHNPRVLTRSIPSAAAYVGELRRVAPVVAVQGHSEYSGTAVGALARAGVRWLSNEGTLLGSRPGFVLLGLNQHVGHDDLVPIPEGRLEVMSVEDVPAWGKPGSLGGGPLWGHYDPAPASLTDSGGPLAWSGYQVDCRIWVGEREAEAGIAVHSRYPLGEDRMIRLRRPPPGERRGSFVLDLHGAELSAGEPDTGVDPEPGRWYRVRLRTEVDPDRVRVRARVWPEGEEEPATWQAWGEDRSPGRAEAGTVGLWAGVGRVAYRDLRVTGVDGRLLLEAPMAGPGDPTGFRQGARGTRLALALARSPRVPGAPRIVVSHVPAPALEAAYRGLDAVLAGHTHGGQVRLPGGRAILTRSVLGPHFDRGLFHLAAPNPRGWLPLYVNSGVGTSLMPVRFLCPPRYAVIEVGR